MSYGLVIVEQTHSVTANANDFPRIFVMIVIKETGKILINIARVYNTIYICYQRDRARMHSLMRRVRINYIVNVKLHELLHLPAVKSCSRRNERIYSHYFPH